MNTEAMQAIIETLADGVIVADDKGLIVFANPSAASLFGVGEDELVGRTASALSTYIEEAGIAPFEFLRTGSPEEDIRRIIRRPDGSRAPIRVKQILLPRGGGAEIMSYDRAERELSELRADLGSTLSHDIRAGISGAVLGVDAALTVTGAGLSERTRSFLSRARLACDRTLWLVSDAHDVARLEAGLTCLKRTSVSLKEVVEKALIFVRLDASDADIDLVTDHTVGPVTISADEDRVTRLIHNLGKLAIDSSPRGCQVKLRSSLSESGAVELSFTLGPVAGLSPYAERLFDRYRLEEVLESMRMIGRSCAFSYCRIAAEAHGWRITAARKNGALEYRLVIPAEHVIHDA